MFTKNVAVNFFSAAAMIALVLSHTSADAQSISLCSQFAGLGWHSQSKVPIKVPMKAGENSGLTRSEFNEVAMKINRLYSAEFQTLGGQLNVRTDWNDSSVNANANELGWVWTISLYGGLARQPLMNRDAFALVACHEIGHHLGGTPNALFSPLTDEGQADYYATLKCARRFFNDEDNYAALKKTGVDHYLSSECRKEFAGDQPKQYVCMRSGMAALRLTKTLQAVNGDDTRISFQTPDPKRPLLFSTLSHPQAQCRLDTFLNGARCPVKVEEPLSEKSYWPGTCDREGERPNTGSRPRCWFKPI